MFRRIAILGIIIIGLQSSVLSQVDDRGLQNVSGLQEDIITSIIEGLETNDEFDYNTLYEDLKLLQDNPINLNEATEEDLKTMILLDDIQIQDLLSHRARNGDLLTLFELQSITSFDINTIKSIKPFVTVNESDLNYNVPLTKMIVKGKNNLYTKWRRVMEEQQGYVDRDGSGPAYEGDPNRFYVRYNHTYENRLKYGFTAEKDPGEAFFSGSNKQGFDFYSAHFHLKDYRSWLKDVVIGDYTISMGQGLILHNAFGGGKSSSVMNIKRGGRAIKSYNSINESVYYRGLAAEVRLSKNIDVLAFASYKNTDGNRLSDTIEIETGLELFTSLIENGYHRTEAEIAKERGVSRISTGGRVKYHQRNFKIAVNGLYEKFDRVFSRRSQLYNKFQFVGQSIANTSIDYTYRYNNISFFGESAVGQNGAMAHIHGILMGLDRKVDLSVVYRDYARDYQVLNANSFGETIGTTNEKGLYTGLSITPASGWKINAYADLFEHPWLRFRKDAPSGGKEYLVRVDHFKKRTYTFYVQYRYEEKGLNTADPESPIDQLGTTKLHRLRLHAMQNINKELSLRNRVEFSWFDRDGNASKGYMIYQDVVYKPANLPFSMSARYALFDTESFDNRIYAYENDLLYEFYIPFFRGRGRRYYANFRYNINRNITAEFRYARTNFTNAEAIGSTNTNELIIGNNRTELKAQVRFSF